MAASWLPPLILIVNAHGQPRGDCETVDVSVRTDQAVPPLLRSAVVLRVEEERCHVADEGSVTAVEYAPQFPAPRLERVTPGHRVALVAAPEGRTIALWRWYDAVVIGSEGDVVRLWEPAHGEVLASPRDRNQAFVPGTRAYLSAGLPGAEWWVAGPVDAAATASVELDEVGHLYSRHQMWESALR